MTSQRLGYGRVSALDRNLDAHADALTAAGANKIFIEKITGTKASRPELDKLGEQMSHGATLVTTRLDRLGRSAKDLLSISGGPKEKDVALEALEQNTNTTTPEGKLFFTLIAVSAEFEHPLMVARTKDGLAATRARDRVGGRKPKLPDAQRLRVDAASRRGGPLRQRAHRFRDRCPVRVAPPAIPLRALITNSTSVSQI